jgi:hypothetical protein
MRQADLCWNSTWSTIVEVPNSEEGEGTDISMALLMRILDLWHFHRADVPSRHIQLGASGFQHSSMHPATAWIHSPDFSMGPIPQSFIFPADLTYSAPPKTSGSSLTKMVTSEVSLSYPAYVPSLGVDQSTFTTYHPYPLFSLRVERGQAWRFRCSSHRPVRVRNATRCRALDCSSCAELKPWTSPNILPTG